MCRSPRRLPRLRAVSSVVGICGLGGASGGMLVSSAGGFVFAYLVGLSVIHVMSPRLETVNLEVRNT